MANKPFEKMLYIINFLRNADETHKVIPPCIHERG